MTETRSYPERGRERIKSTLIIKRLMKHIKGEIDMTSTQIQAARILLNKTLPDIKSLEVEHTGTINLGKVRRLSDEELYFIAGGGLSDMAAPVIEGEAEAVEEPLKLALK